MVYEYNVAIHSATNQSPLNLFFGRSGFNTVMCPIDSSIVDLDENHIDIQVKIIDQDDKKAIDTISVNQKYLALMDRKCVHNSINDINIGDIILIKKDFDTRSIIVLKLKKWY